MSDLDLPTLLRDLHSPEASAVGEIETEAWPWLATELVAWLIRTG